MALIEKIRPIGINTDISPKSIENGNAGNRSVVNPVIDCLNRHYWTSENGDAFEAENIKGTTLVSNSLPSGENVCIGTYEDRLNNQLIFWNFNSNDDHGVYAYSPETGLITELLQVDGLDFQNDRRYLITGAGSIGQLLYWSDGINPQRVINMTRDYSYGTFSLSHITLIKAHPITRVQVGESAYYDSPKLDRTYDSAIKTNKVTDRNIQFSYRYKFLDNEYSVIAPYSTLSFADYLPDQFNPTMVFGVEHTTYSYNNKIRVRLTVPTVPNAFIKNIELLFRENNTGNWYIWNTSADITADIDTYFTGSESLTAIDQTETSKLFEAVSNFSKALAITKDRLFITADEEGFDVNSFPVIGISEKTIDQTVGSTNTVLSMTFGSKLFTPTSGTFILGERIRLVSNANANNSMTGIVIELFTGPTQVRFYVDTITGSIGANPWNIHKISTKTTAPDSPSDVNKTYFKTNGSYIFGLSVFDDDQRCMGIISKHHYNASPSTISRVIVGSDVFSVRKGDIFLKATISGSFVLSPKVKYYSLAVSKEQVYQQYVQCLVRPLFYLFDKPDGYVPTIAEFELEERIFAKEPTTNSYNRIFLQMPKEMPFVPDNSCFVRLLDTQGEVAAVNKVMDVIGDFIVIADFGIPQAVVTVDTLYVEIFQPKLANDGLFYEISDRFSVDGSGLLSRTTIDSIFGDNYRPIFAADYPYAGATINLIDSAIQTFRGLKTRPTYFSIGADFALYNPELPSPTTKSSGKDPIVYDPTIGTSIGSSRQLQIPDYEKIAYNQGKAIAEVPDKKALPRTSVIRFSNKYIQDTNINGMSSFDTGNQYPLSYTRGPITKLQPIANRMLAIHERATTTLFLNEKIIKNADGSDQLIATGDTIGYDTQLAGDFGCYHPESIIKVEDDINAIFGFDIYKGVVWRSTLEGQFPVSNYGRKQYFRDKANAYISDKNGVKIIGGHDPFHKEYVITFNDGTGGSETIAFNYVKNVWTTRYSFVPEYYGKINNNFISFKDGALWVHNSSDTYNNFYGVQYESFIKIAVNPHPTKVKIPLGIDLAIESISDDIDYLQVEISTAAGQYSYLKADEWDKKENVYYADILRDVNTPGIGMLLPNQIGLRDGDEIRSKYFLIQVNDDKTTKNQLQMLNLNYERSDYSE